MDGPDLASYLTGWDPAPVETAGLIDRWPAEAFAGLLDQPSPVRDTGDPLPPMWHGFHLLAHPAQAELGADGHPVRGAFLPPLPDRRRMFAGGRLQVREPLRIGDEVQRRSSLVSAAAKAGRSGAMVLVTERHEYRRAGVSVLVEEQDYAYRSQRPGVARPLAAEAPVAAAPAPPRAWQAQLSPDAALLFRFSALTYNTHRIHYDQPYVTGVEGYPGLVVHGPLLALLLLELPRRFAPERQVAEFAYRLRRPTFAGNPLVAHGDADGALTAGVPDSPPAITATVTFTAP